MHASSAKKYAFPEKIFLYNTSAIEKSNGKETLIVLHVKACRPYNKYVEKLVRPP
jgi:hypothetical protein